MNRVFMFPGQSSRYPEMLDAILATHPPAVDVVERASEILGRDLLSHYRGGQARFDRNQDVQVGVFLTSHLHLLALAAHGIEAELSLGLSLGEYNHLVHIGAIEFADALRLVDARGRVYDEGPRGMMAALFPIELEELEELLTRAGSSDDVQIANFNSPTQYVVAGEREAVRAVMALAEEELAIEPVVIEDQIPMHSLVFRPVADSLRPHLLAAAWSRPKRPYVSNVLGSFVESPAPGQIVELLARHVYSPVRWRQALDAIVERHPDAVFVEVGPRQVLFNMLNKRWHNNPKFKTDGAVDPADNYRCIRTASGPVCARELS